MFFRTFERLAAILLAMVALPQIANAQAPALEVYGDLPAIEDAALSPSGGNLALLMTINGDRQILVLDATGAPIKQFLVGDQKVRSIEWAGEGAVILFRTETSKLARRYGGEKQEWVRANVIPLDDNRDVISVFADQNYIANTLVGLHGIREVNGRWKGYFGGLRMGRTSGERAKILGFRPSLYEVDLTTGKADQIAFPADNDEFRDWLVGADGQVLASLDLDYEKGTWELKGTGDREIATGSQARGRLGLVGLSANGSNIIMEEFDETQGTARRYSIPLSGGERTEILQNAGIDRYIMDRRNGRLKGHITRSGKPVLDNAAEQEAISKVLRAFPRLELSLIDWTPDLNTIVARTSGNGDSGTWYRLNVIEGKAQVLGAERPAIAKDRIGAISTINYKAKDGLDLDGILTLPPGITPANLPVVIMPHGGPNSQSDPQFDWEAQAYASRGYAVFQPNFRGSTGKGANFVAAGDGEWGGKMQTDISDGLAALAEIGLVDPNRACIVGSSYGGYAALYGVTLQNGIYRCAVSVNGVADMDTMFAKDLSGRSDLFSRNITALIGKNVSLDALSPSAHAKQANAPILLIHGKDDTTVPFEQSVIMQDKLKDAGKQVEFVKLDGEDHFLSRASTRKQMLSEAIAFVEKHNPAD